MAIEPIISEPVITGRDMFIFWLALALSILLSIFIAFRVPDFNVKDIVWIVGFFFGSLGVIIEILKWPLGKKTIDNSKGLTKHIFQDARGPFGERPHILPKESIISVRGKGSFIVWYNLFLSLLLALYMLSILFKWT